MQCLHMEHCTFIGLAFHHIKSSWYNIIVNLIKTGLPELKYIIMTRERNWYNNWYNNIIIENHHIVCIICCYT